MTRHEKRDDASNRMRNVSHTNPYTGETFTTVYERGPAVTDGGRSDRNPAMTGGSGRWETWTTRPRTATGRTTFGNADTPKSPAVIGREQVT